MAQQDKDQQNNAFDQTIDELSNTLKNIEKQNKSNKSKKKDKSSEEEKDPSMILFQSIIESTREMLKSETVLKAFGEISKVIGTDTTKSLIEVMATLMTYSAHNALIIYDELLKSEMQVQFDHISDHINLAKADIAAHQAVIQIHKKSIEELKSAMDINKFTKENGIKS